MTAPAQSYPWKDFRVRSALLQATRAAKLDQAWKKCGVKGVRGGVSITTAYEQAGELMPEYAASYNLPAFKLNAATVRKHIQRWMQAYSDVNSESCVCFGGLLAEAGRTDAEIQAALATDPPTTDTQRAIQSMRDLWGWVEEEGYDFKGPPEELHAAVEVKEMLAELHLSFAAKQDIKLATVAKKQREDKDMQDDIREEGSESEA